MSNCKELQTNHITASDSPLLTNHCPLDQPSLHHPGELREEDALVAAMNNK